MKNSRKIISFSFNAKTHGSAFPPYCYPYILSRSNAELSSIFSGIKNDVPQNPRIFALRIMPAGLYLRILAKRLARKIMKKVKGS